MVVILLDKTKILTRTWQEYDKSVDLFQFCERIVMEVEQLAAKFEKRAQRNFRIVNCFEEKGGELICNVEVVY